MPTIDPSWTPVEGQTGLYLETVVGTYITYYRLHSADGYCFYDKTEEIYRFDEEGNFYLVPEDEVLPSERTYMQYSTVNLETLSNYVSVPVDPSYEIVSRPKDEVTE